MIIMSVTGVCFFCSNEPSAEAPCPYCMDSGIVISCRYEEEDSDVPTGDGSSETD